jgi:hypothetical protein
MPSSALTSIEVACIILMVALNQLICIKASRL